MQVWRSLERIHCFAVEKLPSSCIRKADRYVSDAVSTNNAPVGYAPDVLLLIRILRFIFWTFYGPSLKALSLLSSRYISCASFLMLQRFTMNKTPRDVIRGATKTLLPTPCKCAGVLCVSVLPLRDKKHNIVACYPSQLADRASGKSVLRHDELEKAFSLLPQLNFGG